jgi:hypothetical protein
LAPLLDICPSLNCLPLPTKFGSQIMATILREPNWSEWHPLFKAGRNTDIPREAGLYRIRRSGHPDLEYIGQTGAGLRQRLGMLKGVYKDVMPYNDPHTAGPALWALRKSQGCDYEASVAVVAELSTPNRKGLECVAIARHRQMFAHSPAFNFGRMPLGFSKSTGNTRALATAGKRRRGTPTVEVLKCHLPGMEPVGAIEGDNPTIGLLGLNWSPWTPAGPGIDGLTGNEVGLYLLRRRGADRLLYVGEGKVKDRVGAHLRKGRSEGHSQAFAFRDDALVEFSYVQRNDLAKHQLLEIENDLIAAHIIQTGDVPDAQFLG